MVKAISDCYPERASRRLVFVRLLDGEEIMDRASVRAQELLFMNNNAMYPIVVMAHCATPRPET